MEDIPNEVLLMCINHLPPTTRISCRRLNRLWDLLISMVKPKSLTNNSCLSLVENSSFEAIPLTDREMNGLFIVNDQLYLGPTVCISLPFLNKNTFKSSPCNLSINTTKSNNMKLVNQVNGIYYYISYRDYKYVLHVIKDNKQYTFKSFYYDSIEISITFGSMRVTKDNKILIHMKGIVYIIEHVNTKLICVNAILSTTNDIYDKFIIDNHLYIEGFPPTLTYTIHILNQVNQSILKISDNSLIKYYKIVNIDNINSLETCVITDKDQGFQPLKKLLSKFHLHIQHYYILVGNGFVLVIDKHYAIHNLYQII